MGKIPRLFVLLSVSCVLLVVLSLGVYGLTFDNSREEGGNTYLGKFHVKDMAPEDLNTWREIMSAPRLFAEQDRNHKIYFLTVPEGVTGKIVKNPPGSSFDYNVVFSPAFDVRGLVFQYSSSTGMYELVGNYDSSNFTGFGLDAVIVNRGFPLASNIARDELYIQHPGLLYIEDDLGGTMEGEGEIEDENPWWQHLLDWINSFWKTLKNFIVPKEGYFDDWFQEIKNAAMKKLGPISEVLGKLHKVFEAFRDDTTNTGLYWDVPSNHFYDGFPGMRVSLLRGINSILDTVKTVLTMVCVVITVITCYRRLIVLFEQ